MPAFPVSFVSIFNCYVNVENICLQLNTYAVCIKSYHIESCSMDATTGFFLVYAADISFLSVKRSNDMGSSNGTNLFLCTNYADLMSAGKVKACYQGPLQEAWNPIPRIQFLAVKHACVGWTLACSEKSHGSIKPRSWLCKDDLE